MVDPSEHIFEEGLKVDSQCRSLDLWILNISLVLVNSIHVLVDTSVDQASQVVEHRKDKDAHQEEVHNRAYREVEGSVLRQNDVGDGQKDAEAESDQCS